MKNSDSHRSSRQCAPNYYQILGVSRSATSSEIKDAFRLLAKKFHPDFNPQNRSFAEAKMKEINIAYETLKDSEKRREYDRNYPEKREATHSQNTRQWDWYSNNYSRGEATPKKPAKQGRGSDIRLNIKISLEAAFSGSRGKVTYERQRRCPSCRGIGKLFGRICSRCRGSGFIAEKLAKEIQIPPGVRDGHELRIPYGGHEGRTKNSFGMLYITIRILPHKCFSFLGNNLCQTVSAARSLLKSGTKICAPTIEGKTIRMFIPAGTRPGTIFRLRHLGWPAAFTGTRGDMLIKISETSTA
ncbi:MAG: J domain-containing protein [Opitutales bacterium]|nr:J domain-containing protein [Opitutales bacterium]